MEKQENFNKISEYHEKYNKITVFLTKFIFREDFDVIKKLGFINSYLSNPTLSYLDDILSKNKRYIHLLFNNKKQNTKEITKIVSGLLVKGSVIEMTYELVNNYTVLVVSFPDKYINDFDNVVKGKYSKLSQEFKDKFPTTVEVYNSEKQYIGREYTIYHHIFNKTEWLKNFWLQRLNLVELDSRVELWEKPSEKDIVFNINSII